MTFSDPLNRSGNGQKPKAQTLSLTPDDAYITCYIKKGTKDLQVMANDNTDPLALEAMLIGALTLVHGRVLEQHPVEERLVVVPSGPVSLS